MKTWADFYDFYLADIAGCTYFTAVNEIRRAAQEFCDKSKAWRVDLDPVTTTGESVYDFELESEQELVKLISSKLDGKRFDPLPADADVLRSRGIMPLSTSQFMLCPAIDSGHVLTMKVALKPSNASTGVDDFLFNSFAEAIANGAKARLYLHPDKPYSNPALAKICQDKFDEEIARARNRAERSFSSAPIRTRASFL